MMKLRGSTNRLRRDYMTFLFFIEACDTLYGHVIGLGSTGSEDDVLRLGSNKVRYVLENVTVTFFALIDIANLPCVQPQ